MSKEKYQKQWEAISHKIEKAVSAIRASTVEVTETEASGVTITDGVEAGRAVQTLIRVSHRRGQGHYDAVYSTPAATASAVTELRVAVSDLRIIGEPTFEGLRTG